jgi:nitrate/TMAO reductase-like tetraheme cytochrome c subunit
LGMGIVGKLAVVAFLFVLTGLAVTWASPGTGIAQLTQDQEKLCLQCHSPRDPPTDITHNHTGRYDLMQVGAPCWECHGPVEDPNGNPTQDQTNQYHPTAEEAAAVGKDILTCDSCHFKHDIQQELQTGVVVSEGGSNSTTSGSQASKIAPPIMVWIPMIGAGASLITGLSVIGISLSTRKRKPPKVES